MTDQPEKDLTYYMALPYSMQFTPIKDGWFARIPLLEGCKAKAKSWSEIYDRLMDAKRAWLENALKTGKVIPESETT